MRIKGVQSVVSDHRWKQARSQQVTEQNTEKDKAQEGSNEEPVRSRGGTARLEIHRAGIQTQLHVAKVPKPLAAAPGL